MSFIIKHFILLMMITLALLASPILVAIVIIEGYQDLREQVGLDERH